MHALQSAYTQDFNHRHRRVGHLFQGRYKAFLVERDRYWVALLRYIHRNPVEARVVRSPTRRRDAALARAMVGYVGMLCGRIPYRRTADFFRRDGSTLARDIRSFEAKLLESKALSGPGVSLGLWSYEAMGRPVWVWRTERQEVAVRNTAIHHDRTPGGSWCRPMLASNASGAAGWCVCCQCDPTPTPTSTPTPGR